MNAVNQAVLIIYQSPNGRDNWLPVLPADVPQWVKDQRIVGAMVSGAMCMDPKASSGTTWFKAERATH